LKCERCKVLPRAGHDHDPFLAMWDMWFTNSPMLSYLKKPKIYATTDSSPDVYHFDFTGFTEWGKK
jgi:hypothetical protein